MAQEPVGKSASGCAEIRSAPAKSEKSCVMAGNLTPWKTPRVWDIPLAMRERRNGGKKGPNGGKLPPAEYATRPRQDQRSDETIRTPSETRLRGSQIDESWSVPPPPQKANVTEPLVVRGHYTHNSNAMEGYFSLDRFSENSLIPEDRWFTPIGRSVSRMQ